jgi:hypothetical protein
MSAGAGGPVIPIQATFINNESGALVENDTVPVLSKLNFTTDVRQFSGAFDLEVELALDEDFDVSSHDFVEFWFLANGAKHQIGVGFLEDFVGDDTPQSAVWQGNGREFAGQLINVPFRKQIQSVTSYENFIRTGIAQSYIPKYAAFRSLTDVLSGPNRFAGNITAITQQTMMVGALIQQYADLVLNVAYQNRLGQLEIYGRGTDAVALPLGTAIGALCKGFGQTNVTDMQVRQNFSKIFSECTVFWSASQAYIDGGNPTLNSQRFTNSDPRVAQIYQPSMKVFSADDLGNLAGGVSASQRIDQVARSEIRRSMQNVNAITVTTPYPFYTPPVNQSGIQITNPKVIPFEVQQLWRIRNERRNIDQVMRLVGIHYAQDASSLEVQLAFVEPDTLV